MELALNQLDEVVCLKTTDTYCEYRLKIHSEEEWKDTLAAVVVGAINNKL